MPKNNSPGGEVVPPGLLLKKWGRCILRVGVVFQVMNEAGPELAHVAFDLSAIFFQGIQLSHQYAVSVGLPVLPA